MCGEFMEEINTLRASKAKDRQRDLLNMVKILEENLKASEIKNPHGKPFQLGKKFREAYDDICWSFCAAFSKACAAVGKHAGRSTINDSDVRYVATDLSLLRGSGIKIPFWDKFVLNSIGIPESNSVHMNERTAKRILKTASGVKVIDTSKKQREKDENGNSGLPGLTFARVFDAFTEHLMETILHTAYKNKSGRLTADLLSEISVPTL